MANEPRKPTGELGSVTLTAGVVPGIKWNKIQFPESKRAIEALVIKAFTKAIPSELRRRLEIIDVVQNAKENDLDSTILSARGNRQMDLVELIAVGDFRGRFDEAPQVYTTGDMADRILETIEKKSIKYAGVVNPWLLIYLTNYHFAPSPRSLDVVRRDILSSPTIFERVFFIFMHSDAEGSLEQLFPLRGEELHVLRMNTKAERAVRFRNHSPKDWIGEYNSDGSTLFSVNPK